MRRTLLITNDFPPRQGGIQSYVDELATRLPAGALSVYAPAWPGAEEFDAAQPFPVHRHPGSLMLPVPAVARRAVELLDAHRADAVWFGAAAPLALLGPYLRKHGAARIVASTHGHEVGWSMVPGARQALRRIGDDADALTFVSRYARHRFSAAFGPHARLEYLPPGVDAQTFRPDIQLRNAFRTRLGLGDRPVVICISRLVRRKGQDMLIEALPSVRRTVPDAALVIVGAGDQDRLRASAAGHGVAEHVFFTGGVDAADLPGYYAMADVFAMPCRTRGGGLDVEGLGIVFLEASATGLPVIAGDSGGAPEAVLIPASRARAAAAGTTASTQRAEMLDDRETGIVVDGRDGVAIATAISDLLADPARRRAMGVTGRSWVQREWTWQRSADRLSALLD